MTGRGRVRALDRLTALRAFGALAVFAYHAGYNLHLPVARRLFADGYAGVGFFFVLSGFVLTWVARPGDRATTFYRRRVARIYPAYVVASVVAIIVSPGFSVAAIAANLALIQGWFSVSLAHSHLVTLGVNPPSWSLTCEAFFYLCFPAIAWLATRITARAFVALSIGWAVWCSAVAATLFNHTPTATSYEVAYFLPVVRSGEFLLGCGLCVALRSGWRPPWRTWHAAALLVGVGAVVRWADLRSPNADVVLLPCFAILIAAAAAADIDERPGWLTTRAMTYAGEISYAFYIIQYPVLVEVYNHVTDPWPATLLAAFATTGAAIVLHHVVERPIQRLIAPRRLHRVPQLSDPALQ